MVGQRRRFYASQLERIERAYGFWNETYAAWTYSDDEAKAVELDRLRVVGKQLLWLKHHYKQLSKELD